MHTQDGHFRVPLPQALLAVWLLGDGTTAVWSDARPCLVPTQGREFYSWRILQHENCGGDCHHRPHLRCVYTLGIYCLTDFLKGVWKFT